MAKQTFNNIKLGLFILAGLLLLIIGLYLIGRDSNLFSRNYTLHVQFAHVQGLTPGNNVRYAGIQVGTVKKIKLVNDTLIDVSMIIEKRMQQFIRVNDLVSISTDGLMGNKMLQITAAKDGSAFAADGDMLKSKTVLNVDEMLVVLNKSNQNIAIISEELKTAVIRLNNSEALWNILNNKLLPEQLLASAANIRSATAKANVLAGDLQTIIAGVKEGKGTMGQLLSDTAIAYHLTAAIDKIKTVGDNADSLANELNALTRSVKSDVNNGKGTIHALLKDSLLVQKLNNSLQHIEKGTEGFNQNMEALKSNFLFRGYFRKLEKKKNK
jgi:phospholipid/cholesterol/gamma-HCH transport system substrate-binding protein